MTEFTSDTKVLPYSSEKVFNVLSDLSNLERVKSQIPNDKVQDFSFDRDWCEFSVSAVGKVRFSIVERVPYTTIQFAADKTPIDVNFRIQLEPTGEAETGLKLVLNAQLNPFLKPMLSKPLQEGINKIADILAVVPYDQV